MANYEELQGITVKVDAAPGGVPAGTPIDAGFLLAIDSIVDKNRNVKKYNAINSDLQIVSTGRLEKGPFSMDILYSPELTEGVNKLESAIDNNEEVEISLELDNSAGENGTTYTKICKISSFKVVGEEDGKLKASISAEVVTTAKTAAA